MAYTAAKDDTKTMRADLPRNDNGTDDNMTMMAHRAGQKLSGLLGSVYNSTSQTAEAVTTEIRRRPVQSSLIALGAGYVLAALLRR